MGKNLYAPKVYLLKRMKMIKRKITHNNEQPDENEISSIIHQKYKEAQPRETLVLK